MAGLGSLNILPFQIGGGPTSAERAYKTLRQAVGEGGSAPDDRGIDGLWRRSKAQGLAAATSHCRRALNQAFPFLATDLLPYYERILGIVPPTGATEASRREEVTRLWVLRTNSVVPSLAEELLALDSRLTIVQQPHDKAGVAQFGRAFAALDDANGDPLEAPEYGLERGHAVAPGYSTDQIVNVLFAVGHAGPLTDAELVVVERAKRLLRKMLGSDTDFQISVEDGLWHLGVTPIGFGGVA